MAQWFEWTGAKKEWKLYFLIKEQRQIIRFTQRQSMLTGSVAMLEKHWWTWFVDGHNAASEETNESWVSVAPKDSAISGWSFGQPTRYSSIPHIYFMRLYIQPTCARALSFAVKLLTETILRLPSEKSSEKIAYPKNANQCKIVNADLIIIK